MTPELQEAASSGATGVLSILTTSPVVTGGVFFHGGQVVAAAVNGRTPALGRRLVGTNLVDPVAIERLFPQGGADINPQVGSAAVRAGFLEQGVLEAVHLEYLVDDLDVLLASVPAESKFHVGREPDRFAVSPMSLSSVLRTLDERRELCGQVWVRLGMSVGPDLTVPHVVGLADGCSTFAQSLAAWLDGSRTLTEAGLDSGFSRFEAIVLIGELVNAGVVKLEVYEPAPMLTEAPTLPVVEPGYAPSGRGDEGGVNAGFALAKFTDNGLEDTNTEDWTSSFPLRDAPASRPEESFADASASAPQPPNMVAPAAVDEARAWQPAGDNSVDGPGHDSPELAPFFGGVAAVAGAAGAAAFGHDDSTTTLEPLSVHEDAPALAPFGAAAQAPPPVYDPPAYDPPAFDPPAYDPPAFAPPTYEPVEFAPPAYDRPTLVPTIDEPYAVPAFEQAPPPVEPAAFAAPILATPPVAVPEAPPAWNQPQVYESHVVEPIAYDPPAYPPPTYAPPAYPPPAYAPPTSAPPAYQPPTYEQPPAPPAWAVPEPAEFLPPPPAAPTAPPAYEPPAPVVTQDAATEFQNPPTAEMLDAAVAAASARAVAAARQRRLSASTRFAILVQQYQDKRAQAAVRVEKKVQTQAAVEEVRLLSLRLSEAQGRVAGAQVANSEATLQLLTAQQAEALWRARVAQVSSTIDASTQHMTAVEDQLVMAQNELNNKRANLLASEENLRVSKNQYDIAQIRHKSAAIDVVAARLDNQQVRDRKNELEAAYAAAVEALRAAEESAASTAAEHSSASREVARLTNQLAAVQSSIGDDALPEDLRPLDSPSNSSQQAF